MSRVDLHIRKCKRGRLARIQFAQSDGRLALTCDLGIFFLKGEGNSFPASKYMEGGYDRRLG